MSATNESPRVDSFKDAATPSTTATQKNNITIGFFPELVVAHPELITNLVKIIVDVYRGSENRIFGPAYERTNEAEISQFIQAGQLALAIRHPSSNSSSPPDIEVVGCVFVKLLSPELGDFGMLACSTTLQGQGLGRDLVSFAEAHCRKQGCSKMQCELLFPTTVDSPAKKRLQGWYKRMGYRVVKLGNFQEEYPHLAPQLLGPTDYKVFEKGFV